MEVREGQKSMIEVSTHDKNTGERLSSQRFKTVMKANDWINKYPHSHQMRVRTIPDQPKSKMWAIAIPLALTAIGICYLILHKWG